MRYNRFPPLAVLVLLPLLLVGCAHLQPGSDPALVRAEQGLEAATATLDMLVVADFEHRAELEVAVPGAHAVADRIRLQAPPVLRATNAAIDTYRAYLALVRAPATAPQTDAERAAAAARRTELEVAMVLKLSEATRLAADATAVLQRFQKGGGA